MFKWFKSLVASPASPPVAAVIERDPTVVDIFIQALQAEGCDWLEQNGEVSLPDGLTAKVEYLESQAIRDNAVRTVSKITCKHALFFPDGIFEYQHAFALSEAEALLNGFRTWVQTDLATLIDAVADEKESCLVMEMSWPPTESEAALKRKIFMGPYVHSATEPALNGEGCDDQSHDFCPCCLFTKSFEAFTEQLQSREFIGVRLYASRYADGTVVADCRINGHEYPVGAEHLKKYAATWPNRGLESRKQYVAIRRVD